MKKLLVLGGGQLARYLVKESHSLDVQVISVSNQANDPAGLINPNHKVADIYQLDSIKSLIHQADLVTFESEFISADMLKGLPLEDQKKFFPSIRALEVFQDRKSQKDCLVENKIPCLPYLQAADRTELEDIIDEVGKVVLKVRTGGYDGYGTLILDSESAIPEHLEFNKFIVEPFLKFKRELAITVYRNKDGESGYFPMVEWKAKDNKCFWVKGPTSHPRQKAVFKKLASMLDKLSYVGVFSAEFFETAKGELFVNEVAPRVHNSCHYSLNATTTSQFYMHLMCGLNRHVPETVKLVGKGFAMVNLIGTGDGPTRFSENEASVWVYDYQKSKNHRGRKLGHINALSDTPEKALKLALKAEEKCQK